MMRDTVFEVPGYLSEADMAKLRQAQEQHRPTIVAARTTNDRPEPYIEIAIKGEAEIAKLEPGDLMLVRVDCHLTMAVKAHIDAIMAEAMPPGVRWLIFGKEIDLSILRPAGGARP